MRRLPWIVTATLILGLAPIAPVRGEGAGPAAKVVWAQALGGKGRDEGRDVATNAKGMIAVTGFARDAAQFGGPALKTAARGTGAFVSVHGPDGKHRWSKLFGGGRTTGFGVALSDDGGVALTGMNGGQLDFGGGKLPGPTNLDVFVATFKPDGSHRWSLGFGGGGDDVGCAVAFDPQGNVVVAGVYHGAVSLAGHALPDTDSIDVFVVKYAAADGKVLWQRTFGGPGRDGMIRGGHYLSLKVMPSGDILLAGAFEETLAIGAHKLTSRGEGDGFVAQLAKDGTPAWAVSFGGPQDDVVHDVTHDGSGHVFACGGFQAKADFGGGALTSAAQNDVFVVKLTPAGKHAWSRRYGAGKPKTGPMAHMRFPTQPEHACGIALGADGGLVVAGLIAADSDLGAGALSADGRQDGFVLVLGADGSPLRSSRLGGPGSDMPRALAPLPGGDVVLTGSMQKTWPAAGGKVTSAGREDVFLARVSP